MKKILTFFLNLKKLEYKKHWIRPEIIELILQCF